MLRTFFDNTNKVKSASRTNAIFAEQLCNADKGREEQVYKVGQLIDGCGYGFHIGRIVEVYSNHGYYYYIVEHGKNKNRTTLRQKDIKTI